MSKRDSEFRFNQETLEHALGMGKNPLEILDEPILFEEPKPSYFIQHRGDIQKQLQNIIDDQKAQNEDSTVYEQVLRDYNMWWLNGQHLQWRNKNPRNQITINPLKMCGDLNQLAQKYRTLSGDLIGNHDRLEELSKRAVIKDATDLDTILRNVRYETGIHMKDIFDDQVSEDSYPYSSLILNTEHAQEGFTSNGDSFGMYKEDNKIIAFSKDEVYCFLDGKLKLGFKARGNLITQTDPDYEPHYFNNVDDKDGDEFIQPAVNLVDLLSRYSNNKYKSIISSPLRNPILILENENRDHLEKHYSALNESHRKNCVTIDGIEDWFKYNGKESNFEEFKNLYESQSDLVKSLLHVGMRQGRIKDPLDSLRRGMTPEYKSKRLSERSAQNIEDKLYQN